MSTITGRRERPIISCVTFDTIKVSDPVKLYDATKVHLIHYIFDPTSEKGKIYQKFYDRVCYLIREKSQNIPIIEHNANVTNFTEMLKTVYGIIENEYDLNPSSDVFVNISAGSSEYAAAAAIASMMFPGTIPFSVATDKYQVEETDIYFNKEGNPVGLAKSVKEPKVIPKYQVNSPDEKLVLGLKILNCLNDSGTPPKGPIMIYLLKKNKLWRRGEFPEESRNRSEAVYYQRDFVNLWLSENWIYKDKYTKKYYLTECGMIVLKTFYVDKNITYQ